MPPRSGMDGRLEPAPPRAARLGEGDVRGRRCFSLFVGVLLAVFTAGVGPIRASVLAWSSGPADAEAGGTGVTRAVQAATSTGRQGAYYLPRGYESRALPLLVFFHGTGGKGFLAILRLQALAEEKGFIFARGAEEDEGVSSFDQGLRNRIHGTPTTRKTPKKIIPRMRPYVQKSLLAI